MTSKEKIEYMLKIIREKARLCHSPMDFLGVRIDLINVYFHNDESIPYPDDAPLQFSIAEQVEVLYKFVANGLIDGLDIADRIAHFSVLGLDIDSDDNPYMSSKSGTVLLPTEQIETDLEKGILVLNTGETIHISGQSGNENNPLRLLKTLSKDAEKEWAEDEILSDWEGSVASVVKVPKDRVYQAYINLQKKIEKQTGIKDLIGYRNKTYRLNSKYL